MIKHNVLRDTEAKLMEKVCKDVRTEPKLLPEVRRLNGNEEVDRKRPDISARGMWSPAEKTFFDISVTHPNADSYLNKSLATIYREKEMYSSLFNIPTNSSIVSSTVHSVLFLEFFMHLFLFEFYNIL